MPPLPLTGGFYVARSIIADAQRCVNLYPEKNPADSPQPYTMYATPGLTALAVAPTATPWRGFWPGTDGMLYGVCGQTLYQINTAFVLKPLGQLNDGLSTPVSMCDNGNVLVLVNGQSNVGWAVDLTQPARPFAPISDANFLGSVRVDYVDTFFLFAQPGTRNWYSSLSSVTFADLTGVQGAIESGNVATPGAGYVNGVYPGVLLTGGAGTGAIATVTVAGHAVVDVALTASGKNYSPGDPLSAAAVNLGGVGSGFDWVVETVQASAFDPTYEAEKTGTPDNIATLIMMHREIWLIGTQRTSEVWYNAGNAGFPFAIASGVYIEHGTIAPYSVAKHDLQVFWLGADKDGRATVYRGANYAATPVSTPAIAYIFSQYPSVSDAIGMTYKQQDHVFYVLTFPSADVTWVYDLTENLWHQRMWEDSDGGEHRIRANAMVYAGPNYGDAIVCGDWQNGKLYSYDLANFTDDGAPLVRRRTFPHALNDSNRATYPGFRADADFGTAAPPQTFTMSLRWSDDRGRTFSNPVEQTISAGAYVDWFTWRQLGLARDRVFEVFWSDPIVALQGAWLDPAPVPSKT